mmetsp:Transcript_9329/g.12884  ORF Transcript_9329/g.12884 Transcript_9329/m.12884 type:complete len:91 (+) Transcript_9329:2-274(+)
MREGSPNLPAEEGRGQLGPATMGRHPGPTQARRLRHRQLVLRVGARPAFHDKCLVSEEVSGVCQGKCGCWKRLYPSGRSQRIYYGSSIIE